MKLLVINPNTSDSVTALIEAEARRSMSPDVELVMAQAPYGVAYIETRWEALIAGEAVAQTIARHGSDVDAVVVAAFGDPGIPALKEMCQVPVVGITEAALSVASLVGQRFSILAISPRITAWYADAVARSGLTGRLASIRSLTDPLRDIGSVQEDFTDEFLRLSDVVVREDGADAVILAGAPLAGLARRVRDRVGVPLVDGIDAGVRMAEVLARSGVGRHTVGSLAPPPEKPSTGLDPRLTAHVAAQRDLAGLPAAPSPGRTS